MPILREQFLSRLFKKEKVFLFLFPRGSRPGSAAVAGTSRAAVSPSSSSLQPLIPAPVSRIVTAVLLLSSRRKKGITACAVADKTGSSAKSE